MSYADLSMGKFLDSVASEQVTPAGGSAAAVGGAIGAALCEMVCVHSHCSGERDDSAGSELGALGDEFRAARSQLLDLADADADAVDALLSARDATDGTSATEARRATGVPLAIAEACVAVLDGATVVVVEGNRNAVPDAVTGVTLAHAALRASLYTVRANLDGTDDESFVGEIERRAAELERAGDEAYDEAMALV